MRKRDYLKHAANSWKSIRPTPLYVCDALLVFFHACNFAQFEYQFENTDSTIAVFNARNPTGDLHTYNNYNIVA